MILRELLKAFLSKIFLDNIEFILYDNTVYFDPDQALNIASVQMEKVIGQFGRIKPEIARRFEIDSDVFGFEFSVDAIKESYQSKPGSLRFFQDFRLSKRILLVC